MPNSYARIRLFTPMAFTVCLLLAGCGGSGKPSESGTESKNASQSAAAPPETLDLRSSGTTVPAVSASTPNPQQPAIPSPTPAGELSLSSPSPATAPTAAPAKASDGANRLAQASSPYLRRAAKAPVHWMEWGPEAFERAKTLNRPMVIFIGANWCRWCHLMDEQTFANAKVAEILNRDFVAVRVDRDERPDVDERYQAAHFVINRKGGGWPLTVFALPDGRPFDSLTYVPAETAGEQIGMTEILPQAVSIFRQRGQDAAKTADSVQRSLASAVPNSPAKSEPEPEMASRLLASIASKADSATGGFGTGDEPRFPHGTALLAMLQDASDNDSKNRVEAVSKTLRTYFKGGLRDNIHGGYYLYCSDAAFSKPSFEKVLYVQAELLSAFSLGYAASGNRLFKEAAADILKFTRDTLENPDGGFYSSQDADTGTAPGNNYHTWTKDEVEKIAGAGSDTNLFLKYFNIGAADNTLENGRSPLRSTTSLQAAAEAVQADPAAAQKALDTVRKKLRDARTEQADIPYVDKTILASWNGPMISAYMDAYRYTGDREARDFALKSMDFIITNMVSERDGVAHAFGRGKASVYGLLAPQVQVAAALLDCFEVSGRKEYLENAESLMDFVEKKFLDKKSGLYGDRLIGEQAEGLLGIARFPVFDSTGPASNPMAAIVWYRLYQATGNEQFLLRARRIVAACAFQGQAGGPPAGTLARAAAILKSGPPKVLLVGPENDATVSRMREAALAVFRMGKIVESLTPQEAAKTDYPPAQDGGAIAYICTAANCAPPVRDPAKIADVLKTFGKKTVSPSTTAPGSTRESGSESAPPNRRAF